MNERRLNIPGYEVKEELGSGGGGTVYRAWHTHLHKDVVIKKIHESITDEEQQRTEVDILKNLHHPNLPQVFDYFVLNGVAYTVMDYVQGKSLQQLLDEGMQFSEKTIINIAKELTDVLAYLHSQKVPVIHGDIKPDNLMYSPDGHVYLIDFNISGISINGVAKTYGYTPGYGAPEQFESYKRIKKQLSEAEDKTELLTVPADDRTELLTDSDETEILFAKDGKGRVRAGESDSAKKTSAIEIKNGIEIDKRSDVYSAGATIYRLYTGKLFDPYKENILSHRTSDGFVYFLNKSLQAEPAKRYRDAVEMHKALSNLHKNDRRYKSVELVQNIIRSVLVILIISGVFLIVYGSKQLEKDKESQYFAYISELEMNRDLVDIDGFEDIYSNAVELIPSKIDAYIQKALFLYELGLRDGDEAYLNNIEYIQNSILSNPELSEQDDLSEVYYILGNSFFELGSYQEASDAYESAINHNTDISEYYVDRAISLARMGNSSEAQEMLDRAIEKGAIDANVYLSRGEIEYSNGEYSKAVEDLKKCIQESEDDYKRFRAYIRCAQAISEQKRQIISTQDETVNSSEIISLTEHSIELLNQAKEELPISYKQILLNQMAAEYIDTFNATEDLNIAGSAIDVYEEIKDNYGVDFTGYCNMVSLYHVLGRFEKEKDLLNEMDEKKYKDNYVISIYQAILAATLLDEALADNDETAISDYVDEFVHYYSISRERIEMLDESRKNDPLIRNLESIYEELQNKGWIESEG